MSLAFSIYLDLVRFIAACLVFMYHSNQRLIVTKILPASDFGHSAVIVFFVLSGFVIAHVVDTKEKDWASYAASRLARVYSVAVPAIVLTVVLDAIGRTLYPAIYGYPFDRFLLRLAGSLLMLNEVWFVSITSFSNIPYWSICYEIWYYVLFGLITFLPRRYSTWSVPALALLLGPKLLLLAPLWAAGVVLYRWKALQDMRLSVGWAMVVASIVGIVLFHRAGLGTLTAEGLKAVLGARWYTELTFSKFFIGDYALGILVMLNFAGMRRVADQIGPVLLAAKRPIRWLAGYTLTLYLLHQPLFLFWAAVLHGDPAGYTNWWSVAGLVALSVVGVGHFTETRRHTLRHWLEQRLRRLSGQIAKNPHAFSR